MFCLNVILKSPRIGWSLSRVCCAKEIAVMAEIEKRIATKNDNLSFIRTPVYVLGPGMSGSYQKVSSYSRTFWFPSVQKRNQVFLQHSARGFEFAVAAAEQQATIA